MTPDQLNFVALLLDIAAALLIGWEALRRHHGPKHRLPNALEPEQSKLTVEEDADYVFWERRHYFRMRLGLIALLIGVGLQITALRLG